MKMKIERDWKILRKTEDVTPQIEADVESCVDWFDGEPTMGTEEFLDRLCKTYGGSGWGEHDYDLDSYDSPVARKIMRLARKIRKESQS